MIQNESILEVRNLSINYSKKSQEAHALRSLSLNIPRHQIVGIAGESGSGKSSLGKAVMRLVPKDTLSGEIVFHSDQDSSDLLKLNSQQLQKLRGKEIAIVFQEALSAFNPVYTIGKQIQEAREIHYSGQNSKDLALESLEKVGLEQPERIYISYPHEVSGGQLQRAGIAMAIINSPQILIADEITTALDNLTQKGIIKLIQDLNRELKLTIMLISHDIRLLGQVSHQLVILKDGELLEFGETKKILAQPVQDYTKRLITESQLESKTAQTSKDSNVILNVKNLGVTYTSGKSFFSRKSSSLNAVQGVSFQLNKGESLGIIGQSGSGKSSIASAILNLLEELGGEIRFEGASINELTKTEMRRLRKRMQVIFQNPEASLDPRISVGESIRESLKQFDGDNTKEKVLSLLRTVKLDESFYTRLPRELSGGEKQRICIARALSYEPKLLICDEAVSSLDAPVKKEILDLLQELKQNFRLSILFISHDLGVVSYICERIIVLKDGRIVEEGTRAEICNEPKEDYTKSLLESSLKIQF